MTAQGPLYIRFLGKQNYQTTLASMRAFTDARDKDSPDELWLLEHEPVFTQGRAGKAEHLLLQHPDIPLVQSDRGGQVTYHGPGQLIAYPLVNLKRLGVGVRDLVMLIEQSVVDCLAEYGIHAEPKREAPGVYVVDKKIASLGLRIRRGSSFHGVAINVNMDLSPFLSINPCGYAGLEMVQLSTYLNEAQLPSMQRFQQKYAIILAQKLGYSGDALMYESSVCE